jgi:hypothetical protein
MMASRKAILVISKVLEHTVAKPIPEDSLEMWQTVLAPLSDDLAMAAAMRVARTARKCFAVAPGAIYQMALEILREDSPNPGAAWAMVNAALEKVEGREGWGDFVDLPDAIQAAAKQVGIPGLMGGMHVMADRARFLEFYGVITERQAKAQLVLPSSTREALSGAQNVA